MNGAVLYDNKVRYGTTSESDLSFSLSEIEEFGQTFQTSCYFPHFIDSMEATQTTQAGVVNESELEQRFETLAEQWLEETRFSSSINDIISHPAHTRIIGMGTKAIPLILRRLSHRAELWFWALSSLTDENPVNEDIRGNIQEMRRAWLDWGQENGQVQ